jgi:hypothetical protein
VTPFCHERRAFRRAGASEHGIVSARVRLGYRVAVVDASAGGALIEISKRLLPGSTVDLQVETARGRAMVPGRVVRCAIARLRSNSVSYRAAIAFDRHCSALVDHDRNVCASDGHPATDERVAPTHDTVGDAS